LPLLEDLIRSLRPAPEQVSDVVAGHHWTLVVTSHCGIAIRPQPSGSRREADSADHTATAGQDVHSLPGRLRGKPVEDLFDYALSSEPAEVSVGIAAINAVAAGRCDTGLFRPYRIPRARGRRVTVVGEFHFLDDLRSIAESVRVIPKNPDSGDYTGTGAESLIADSDVVMIGAPALIDGTLEYLLDLARPCYTIIHGPSTPLSPVLFSYGADQIVGVIVKDCEATKRHISMGHGLLTDCKGIQPMVLISPGWSPDYS
jgi:uncharacterized protein (DUF4213/DUF364 family)